MIKYKKVFMDYWGYSPDEYIPCRITKAPAADIHHIDQKGMGGSKNKDCIDNLIATSRRVHDMVQGVKHLKHYLKEIVIMDINKKEVKPDYQPGSEDPPITFNYDTWTKEWLEDILKQILRIN